MIWIKYNLIGWTIDKICTQKNTWKFCHHDENMNELWINIDWTCVLYLHIVYIDRIVSVWCEAMWGNSLVSMMNQTHFFVNSENPLRIMYAFWTVVNYFREVKDRQRSQIIIVSELKEMKNKNFVYFSIVNIKNFWFMGFNNLYL